VETAHEPGHQPRLFGRKPRARFVQQQDTRPRGRGHREFKELPMSLRKVRDGRTQPPPQRKRRRFQQAFQLSGAPMKGPRPKKVTKTRASGQHRDTEVFRHGHRKEDRWHLELPGDPALQRHVRWPVMDVAPVKAHATSDQGQPTGNHVQEGGLSGAVRLLAVDSTGACGRCRARHRRRHDPGLAGIMRRQDLPDSRPWRPFLVDASDRHETVGRAGGVWAYNDFCCV